MDGTPTPSLLLLVAGMAWWAWPRPLTMPSVDTVRRWLPAGGVLWVLSARVLASVHPSSWPHFAAHLDQNSTVLERAETVLIGEGAVVLALTVVTVVLALGHDPLAHRRRAASVLPLMFVCILGLDGSVEGLPSAPLSPTRSVLPLDLLPTALAVLLACTWLGLRLNVSRPAAVLVGAWLLIMWYRGLVADAAMLNERGAALLAAGALLALGPRRAPSGTSRGPRGLVRFVVVTWTLHVALLVGLLPKLLGHDAWSVVSVAMTSTTVLAALMAVMLASLRVGMDAHDDAVWLVGTHALRFTGLAMLVVDVHAGLVAIAVLAASWCAWWMLWLGNVGSEKRRIAAISYHAAYEQK